MQSSPRSHAGISPRPHPAVRTVIDSAGVAWSIRLVMPERAERRSADRRVGGDTGRALPGFVGERRVGADPRITAQRRVHLPRDFAHGWLLLESERGERRRVAPVPAAWERMSDAALALLVRMAARERD